MIIKTENSLGVPVEIEQYDFVDFRPRTYDPFKANVDEFQFKQIKDDKIINSPEHQRVIKQERHYAGASTFEIDGNVSFYRGLKKQKEEERKKEIRDEVKKNLKKMERRAFLKGTDDGKNLAYKEAMAIKREEAEIKLGKLQVIIDEMVSKKEEILKNQLQEIYQMIKVLTKWVILRELKEDGEYIKRLLEKLVLELGSQDNLLIKVNEEKFEEMPVISELVQKKLGEFKNCRIEKDLDQSNPGLVIESMNTILDGSFESQMENLDKIFSVVEEHE